MEYMVSAHVFRILSLNLHCRVRIMFNILAEENMEKSRELL